MKSFNANEYWEKRYVAGGNSGKGSYNEPHLFKTAVVNEFIEDNDIKTILDMGCGDGHFASSIKVKRYIAYDVSPSIIDINKIKYKDKKNISFTNDLLQVNEIIDCTISIDVIYHVTNTAEYKKYLANLFNMSNKYCIIYSSNVNQDEEFIQKYHPTSHVFHRQFTKDIDFSKWKYFDYLKEKNKTTDLLGSFFFFKRI
jgi:2-polyprenyl-3-methyl-5-hydroxy-6-metoxy-1,4-benzoquinol methylase